MKCFCCHGTENHVTEMTDGRSRHWVCDSCRELVTPFFLIYRDLTLAVKEVAQAKRGSQT